ALALYEGIPHHIFGTGDHLVRCAAIALTGGLAVWSAWLRERREASQRQVALLAEAAPLLSASLAEALREIRLPAPRSGSGRPAAADGGGGRVEALVEALRARGEEDGDLAALRSSR